MDVDQIWVQFKDTGEQQYRDDLIVHYTPLVRYVASRVGAGLPRNVDSADLVSYGMFGLIDAINKFDLDRGFKFETYAIRRIRGEILDALRVSDWVPRSVRAKAKAIEKAMAQFEMQHQRPATDDELAAVLNVSVAKLQGFYTQIANVGLIGLDDSLLSDDGDTANLNDVLADRSSEGYEQSQIRTSIVEAIDSLTERERIVLILYYYENLTLAEIGKVLFVTESRICQIHTKAVLQLRASLINQKEPNSNERIRNPEDHRLDRQFAGSIHGGSEERL